MGYVARTVTLELEGRVKRESRFVAQNKFTAQQLRALREQRVQLLRLAAEPAREGGADRREEAADAMLLKVGFLSHILACFFYGIANNFGGIFFGHEDKVLRARRGAGRLVRRLRRVAGRR